MKTVKTRSYSLVNRETGKHFCSWRSVLNPEGNITTQSVESVQIAMFTRKEIDTLFYNAIAANLKNQLDPYDIVCYTLVKSESRLNTQHIIVACEQKALLNKLKYGNT